MTTYCFMKCETDDLHPEQHILYTAMVKRFGTITTQVVRYYDKADAKKLILRDLRGNPLIDHAIIFGFGKKDTLKIFDIIKNEKDYIRVDAIYYKHDKNN